MLSAEDGEPVEDGDGSPVLYVCPRCGGRTP